MYASHQKVNPKEVIVGWYVSVVFFIMFLLMPSYMVAQRRNTIIDVSVACTDMVLYLCVDRLLGYEYMKLVNTYQMTERPNYVFV